MKLSLTGICVAMFATVLCTELKAQGPVPTLNIVGFTKLTLEQGKLYLISSAFEDIEGNALNAQDVFGSDLPIGSQVTFYDGVTPYINDTRTVAGWSANITFKGSMGFWVKVPTGAGLQPSYELTLKGQVPMQSEECVLVHQGLNMLGYPFTADVAFNATQLYSLSSLGDQLHIYNAATTNYFSSSKTIAGWSASAGNKVLKQGSGFWYKRNGDEVLVCEPRPYAAN